MSCKFFAPVFDATANKHPEIEFERLQLDDPANAEIVRKFDVTTIPRVVMLDDKGEPLYNGSPLGTESGFEMQLDRYRQ
ncbi:MAG TPA: thioredoxin family protein [Planktothrix sp.]|jgi:hypothetical protein